MLTLTIEQLQGGEQFKVDRHSRHLPRVGEQLTVMADCGQLMHGDIIRVAHDLTASPPVILVTLMTLSRRWDSKPLGHTP